MNDSSISIKESTKKPEINEFVLETLLGEGNFSKVMLATHKYTNEKFALKVLEKKKIQRLKIRHPNIYNEIQMEKLVLNKLNHQNIVQLYHTFQDENHLYFLMEYLSGGELWEYLMNETNKTIGLSEDIVRFYIVDMINAMEYLHSMNIVHRDLKPENMMISIKDNYHIKICDFGTAKDMSNLKLNGPNFVGTPEYMSPETINNKSVNFATDIWSLGVILYQLLLGETPFQGGSAYLTFLKIKEGNFHVPNFLSNHAKDLILKLLIQNPNERLGAKSYQDLKSHPFFDKIDFEYHNKSKIPLTSLEYLCLQSIIDHLKNIIDNKTTSNQKVEEESVILYQTFSHLSNNLQEKLQHVLHRVHLLQDLDIYRLFFKNPIDATFHRTRNHSYLGFSRSNESQWKESFEFFYITDPVFGRDSIKSNDPQDIGTCCLIEKKKLENIINKINDVNPRFVIISGKLVQANSSDLEKYEEQIKELKETLSKIHPNISMLFVYGDYTTSDSYHKESINSFKKHFGNDYYSFWNGGVKCIVINTMYMEQMDLFSTEYEKQKKWIEKELELGKLCGHHVLVFGHHPLYIKDENEDTNYIKKSNFSHLEGIIDTDIFNTEIDSSRLSWNIPKKIRTSFINLLKDNNVRAIFGARYYFNKELVLQPNTKEDNYTNGSKDIYTKEKNKEEPEKDDSNKLDVIVTSSISGSYHNINEKDSIDKTKLDEKVPNYSIIKLDKFTFSHTYNNDILNKVE